jgi:hypothetical protein
MYLYHRCTVETKLWWPSQHVAPKRLHPRSHSISSHSESIATLCRVGSCTRDTLRVVHVPSPLRDWTCVHEPSLWMLCSMHMLYRRSSKRSILPVEDITCSKNSKRSCLSISSYSLKPFHLLESISLRLLDVFAFARSIDQLGRQWMWIWKWIWKRKTTGLCCVVGTTCNQLEGRKAADKFKRRDIIGTHQL